MSTGTALTPAQIAYDNQSVSFIPFGEKRTLELKVAQVRNAIAKPTKSGKLPSNSDILRFMKLCEAKELNPFAGDAYMVGFDTANGPEFNLITAVQALFKRAEANPNFDGLEQGVIVRKKGTTQTDEIKFREGDFYLEDEVLLGAWAKCYRRDRSKPFYDAVKLSSFDKGFGRWKDDPAGMIVKCAQSSVLRSAFPTQLGGLFIAEEIHLHGESYVIPPQMPVNPMISDQASAAAIQDRSESRSQVLDVEPPKPQSKSEKLAATRPKKPKPEPAKEVPKPEPVAEKQTEIPEEQYQEPVNTAQTEEPAEQAEEAAEERDLIAEFNHAMQYCPTYQAVMKFRDTFVGPNKTHETTEEQEREITKIAEVEANKRLPPPKTKKNLD